MQRMGDRLGTNASAKHGRYAPRSLICPTTKSRFPSRGEELSVLTQYLFHRRSSM